MKPGKTVGSLPQLAPLEGGPLHAGNDKQDAREKAIPKTDASVSVLRWSSDHATEPL
jgi:hypothetical protein